MVVVADTSPLNYLVQIHCENLLYKLYGKVVVPSSVISELGHSGAPSEVTLWLARLPAWIEVSRVTAQSDEALAELGEGERDAILLVEQLHANLLLIDDKDGRLAAVRRGIATTGTLGVLLAGAASKLVHADVAFQALVAQTRFRSTAKVRDDFLRKLKAINKHTGR